MASLDKQYTDWGWVAYPTKPPTVPIILCGRSFGVGPEQYDAVFEMNRALADTGYENPCDWIGTYKYREVAGYPGLLSHHSADPGIAIDLDYGGDTDGDGDPVIDKNPHLHRPVVASDYGNTIQLLRPQVDAILSIRTVSGAPVWRWLGDINGDSMHFDRWCSRADLLTGVVPYEPIGGPMDPNCPWKNTTDKRGPWYTPDPQCDRHFNPTPNVPLEWGVNTGVCNVPTWGEQAMIDEANDPNGVIVLRDNARDDFNSTLTFGRYIVLKHR